MAGVGDDEALTQQPENTSSEEDDTDEEFVEADNGESQPKKKKDKKDKEKEIPMYEMPEECQQERSSVYLMPALGAHALPEDLQGPVQDPDKPQKIPWVGMVL